MELYLLSIQLKSEIKTISQKVNKIFPDISFEEYIVIPELDNLIMLRFRNNDLNTLDKSQLAMREVKIREIASPNFLANFIGEDYSHFGLKIHDLRKTLIKCDIELKDIKNEKVPNYYPKLQEDISKIQKVYGDNIDIWEMQVHDNKVDVLYFSNNTPSNQINSGDLEFTPVKHDESYKGIIKAELHAIKENKPLLEILLRYQDKSIS